MPLRSLQSEISSPVAFKNLTERSVLLYWIDFSGSAVFYAILRPCARRDAGLEIDTFVSHPWVAVERGSKKMLKLNWKHVFMPPDPSSWSQELRRAVGIEERPSSKPKARDNGVFHLYQKLQQPAPGQRSSDEAEDSSRESIAVPHSSDDADSNATAAASDHDDEHAIVDFKYEVVVTDPVLRLEILCQQKICETIHHEHHCRLPLAHWLQQQLQDTLNKWFY